MKHSPGPWSWTEEGDIISADGYSLAWTRGEDGPIYRVSGERRKAGEKSIAMNRANYQLIAAAPELLEVLKELLKDCDETVELECVHGGAVVEKARAVIAKVESI